MKTLTRLEELLAAASPGEWLLCDGDRCQRSAVITTDNRECLSVVPICEVEADFTGPIGDEQRANAELICAMKNALPALIECVEALEALTELPVAKGELKLLDRGIGTGTENSRWLNARSALEALGNQTLSGPND